MLYFAILLTVSYLGYLVYEKRRNEKYLASFRHIIHVNGIRGKTGVCRLLDAGLRGGGYRVFTKTTGSTPFYIDTAGTEHLIRRKGDANISEQLKIIKQAYREHTEILILECMAVNPELQKISQEKIVKGTINIITNVRYDHIFEMGESLDEIAASLSNTIPRNGMFYTADEDYYSYFSEICQQRNTTAILCKSTEAGTEENRAIAYEVCHQLGITKEKFVEKTRDYLVDFGAHKLYQRGNFRFLNLFSVNDPQSTQRILQTYTQETDRPIFVYNHRGDRPDRLLLFVRYFFTHQPCDKILIMGENQKFCCRLLEKNGIKQAEPLGDWKKLLTMEGALLVGLGNIKGGAYELLNYLEGDAVHE